MRILMAEDDLHLREILLRGLREERYIVDTFVRGDDAELALAAGSFDLAILDWNLPGLSGVELCRRVRRRGSRLPILILTARDAESDRVQGLDSGADDYLVKPFSFDELLARLRALTRRAGGATLQAGIGGVSLRQDIGEVRVGDKILPLSPAEYLVMEKLLLSVGGVVARQDLARSTLADETRAIGSNTLDVQMGRIRRYLREAGARAQILTVRGVGFRLVARDD